MRRTGFTRREIVKTLLALGAGSVFASYLQAFAADGTPVRVAAAENPSAFEIFAAVSAFVTLRDDLDAETMRRMHTVFLDEPWGREHLEGIFQKVSSAISDKERKASSDKSWGFTEGESWFTGHLLTTWYLGIYYHEQRPTRRVAYEHALVFSAVKGLLPVPLLEATGFGNWTAPPEEIP
jgi:hypothetical protein